MAGAWTTQHVDEWCADLRVVGRVSLSTLRGLQGSVRQFCWFLTDPAYGWSGECEREFGTHPVQVCHDEAMGRHVAEVECRQAKRVFSREELRQRELEITDTMVELLIGTVHRIRARAERQVTNELINA